MDCRLAVLCLVLSQHCVAAISKAESAEACSDPDAAALLQSRVKMEHVPGALATVCDPAMFEVVDTTGVGCMCMPTYTRPAGMTTGACMPTRHVPQRLVIPGHPVSLIDSTAIEDPDAPPTMINPAATMMSFIGAYAEDVRERKDEPLLDDSEVQEVETILGNQGNTTGDAEFAEALHDLETNKTITGKDKRAIQHALDKESIDTSPEDELKRTGSVITSELLEKVNGLSESPEIVAGCVEGDMLPENSAQRVLLLEEAAAGKRWAANLWTDKTRIPYCFSSTLAANSKKAFQDALQHYRDHIPCIGFREVAVASEPDKKCATEPGIFVSSSGTGCSANVGQPNRKSDGGYGPTVCHLDSNGCATMGIAAHEIGHNLGMLHEQGRSDHGQFVKVLWDNIKPDKKHNYNGNSDIDTTIPYDIMSLMHYSQTEFGIIGTNGRSMKTMEYVGHSHKPMGNRQGLTNADVQQVAKMYGCQNQVTQFNRCTTKADGCSTADCTCMQHSGFHKLRINANCYQCAKICINRPSGDGGYCGCPDPALPKECFMSGGAQYCGCKVPPPRCPDWNSGSPRECVCPGAEKKCFTQGGSQYCGCQASTNPATLAPKTVGTCSTGSECTSGFCRGGFCCNAKGSSAGCNACYSATDGDCRVCDSGYVLTANYECQVQLTPQCKDEHVGVSATDDCASYANGGYCTSWHIWMMQNCKKSCNFC